jgi:hypothetical protein
MNCQNIEFSSKKSSERIEKALQVFDYKVLIRILAFALHLFGVKRKIIAELINMPEESVKTTIRVVVRDGFQALLDRRKTEHPVIQKSQLNLEKINIRREGEMIIIDLNPNTGSLKIPVAHKIQIRTILLSLMNSKLLSTCEAAMVLEISEAHCRQLAKKLACNDVGGSLIDKRVGQLQDFRVGPIQKAEIIRQFAARAITGHSISSDVITALVNEQTQASLTPRTVRWHMKKFGLTSIKNTLPELANELKKNS